MQDDLAFIYPADISSNSSFTQKRTSTGWPTASSKAKLMTPAKLSDANAATDALAKKFPTNLAGIRPSKISPSLAQAFPFFLSSSKMPC